jgi:transposase
MSDAAGPPTPEPPAEPTAALPDDPVILQRMIYELLDVLRQTRREDEQLQHRLNLRVRPVKYNWKAV